MKHSDGKGVGSVHIQSNQISFSSVDYGHWSIPLNEVALMGEYTSQDGPFLEDHFFVLLLQSGQTVECPTTAQGVHELLETLGQLFSMKLTAKLTLHTDFESRIMAPYHLADRSLYEFRLKKGSMLAKLFHLDEVNRLLTKDASSVLKP